MIWFRKNVWKSPMGNFSWFHINFHNAIKIDQPEFSRIHSWRNSGVRCLKFVDVYLKVFTSNCCILPTSQTGPQKFLAHFTHDKRIFTNKVYTSYWYVIWRHQKVIVSSLRVYLQLRTAWQHQCMGSVLRQRINRKLWFFSAMCK